jgi:LmbE family N-acetylglucosaminyl deacetylase
VNPGLTDTSAAGVAAADQRPPAWSSVLVVVAHPDDETFGLGAVIDLMRQAGTTVQVLCFTHGEASTLNETGASLHDARSRELAQASAELGIAAVDLLDFPDGKLSSASAGELAARVTTAIGQYRPEGILVFDESGVTGHPDHRAATAAAVRTARTCGLPVLAWALPEAVACQLRLETGHPFAGQPPDRVDLQVKVDRTTQCRAALAHASQVSPSAILWRRLQLLGNVENLRWLHPPESS